MSHDDIAPRLLRSAGAATFSQLWRVGVTFATHLVLRRLVPHDDWGLYAWVVVAFLVLGALRDMGMNAHVLRVEPRPFGNLLLVELAWGAGLALLVFAASPWLTVLVKGQHPDFVPVMRALTLFLFFEGLAMVPLSYLDGKLETGRAVAPELARNLCMAAVAISLALAGHGVWSMVVAQIAGSALFAALLWWRVRGRITLHYERGGTWRLLASSYRLAVIWLLVLMVREIDKLVLGALVDLEVLGNYEFAYWAAFIVPVIFLTPVGRVTFPALVAYRRHRRRQFDTYRLSTMVLLCLEVPAALFLFVNAALVLDLLGGAGRWPEAVLYLPILCFAPLIDPLSRLGGEVLASRHRDGWWIAATATTLLSFAGFGLLLTFRYGAIGMAWANFLPLGAVVMFLALRRVSPKGLRKLLRDLAWVYLLPVPFFTLVWLLTGGFEPASAGWRVALSFAALIGVAAAYFWRFGTQFREFFAVRSALPDPGTGVLPPGSVLPGR